MLVSRRHGVVGLVQVQARLDEAGAHDTDGVNFDLEDPAAPGSPLARAYTALVAETAIAFHKRDPAAQVPCAAGARGTPRLTLTCSAHLRSSLRQVWPTDCLHAA